MTVPCWSFECREEKDGEQGPAKYACLWPGASHRKWVCESCAQWAAHVASVMGFKLDIMRLPSALTEPDPEDMTAARARLLEVD